jgi:hypothetical protein
MKKKILEYAAVAFITVILVFLGDSLRSQSEQPQYPVQFAPVGGSVFIYDPNTKILRTWSMNGMRGRKYRIEPDKDWQEIFDK